MPAKRYIVRLTDDERTELLGLTTKGKASARVLTRARILLKADEGWKDKDIVAALNTSVATVERIRRRLVEGNLEKALHDGPTPWRKVQTGRARGSSTYCPRVQQSPRWSYGLEYAPPRWQIGRVSHSRIHFA